MLFILFEREKEVIIKEFRIELIWIPFALNSAFAKHEIFFNFFEYISYIKIFPILVKDINIPSNERVSSMV